MEKHVQRLQSLDIVRGIAVIMMIITHVWISFFWDNNSVVGTVLSYIGGYLSFSIFLIVSGFTFGIGQHKLTFTKTLRKSGELLVIYLGLGLIYTVLKRQDIYSLFKAPIYLEEYLLTLALFPVIAFGLLWVIKRIAFVKKFLLHNVGSFFVLLLGLVFVYLGKFTSTWNTNYFLSLFIGGVGFHTFPLISYFVVYGIGMWLGWSYRLETKKNYGTEATAIVLISALAGVVALPLEGISFSLQSLDAIRWPPTLFFIASGLCVAASMLYGATLMEKAFNNPVGKFFQTVGKYALTLFVAHLLVIYLIQGIVYAKVSQVPSPTVVPTQVSRIITISSILDNYKDAKDKWPFPGYKVAIVKLQPSAMKRQYYAEIRPQDIGALGALQDLSVAAINSDGAITKLSKSIINVKDNLVILKIEAEPSYKAIAFSLSDGIAQPSLNSVLDTITEGKKVTGTKLITLDENYTSWIYQPYGISGQKWFTHMPGIKVDQASFSAYLPISCDDLQYYQAQAKGNLTITQQDSSTTYTPSCTDIENSDKTQTQYVSAKSFVSIPYTLDFTKAKNGKKAITFSFTLPNILGETDYSFDYTKNIAISDPMYVAWTYDWDGIQGDLHLAEVNTLRKEIPYVPVTHFFNPRIWNYFTKTRSDTQVSFVKNGVKTYKDEIQLHLHMFKDMVAKMGVTQSTAPGWGNFGNGYDIPLSEYSYDDTKTMLSWALSEFSKKGLPKPTGFRAGGWMIDMENLKALKDAGLKFDSSARTAFSTSFFNAQGHNYQGPWKIITTQQPYWISPSNQNYSTTKSKSLGVFEMPNNGADSWAYSSSSLLSNFQRNYDEETLSSQRLVTYITHPDFFNTEGPKVGPVLKTISTMLASNDDGPVVFTTLNKYYLNYAK